MSSRDETSKRITKAFTMTERKENHTLREKSRFVGTKRFAMSGWKKDSIKAKSAIDNCRAGRLR